jgi:3-oxoacyl-[acyl-carrier-protein] synthase-1
MAARPIAIVHSGLVTSVGLSAPASCAAIRAALTNHTETRFMFGGEWLLGAQVPLELPWRGRAKLTQMLRLAVTECLEPFGPPAPATLPLLLCVAERSRPGRLDSLDELLIDELAKTIGIDFHPSFSAVIARGRAGIGVALSRARQLMYEHDVSHVLVAAADSLLVAPTLVALESEGRLLTPRNSDGFIPGEAAGALVLARPAQSGARRLECTGLGFAIEPSAADPERPLRADGLTQAIKQSLSDAGCAMHDLDFRITDNSGEQYYFKEAALALSRTLRQRKETFDIWHPADCIGEVGAAIGVVALAVAMASTAKGYAIGPNILFHIGSDTGERAAAVLRYTEAA